MAIFSKTPENQCVERKHLTLDSEGLSVTPWREQPQTSCIIVTAEIHDTCIFSFYRRNTVSDEVDCNVIQKTVPQLWTGRGKMMVRQL